MFLSFRGVADTLDEFTVDNLKSIIPKVTFWFNNFFSQDLVLVIHELNVVTLVV